MAAATPALAALAAAGVPHKVVKFEHDSRVRSFGVEAVHALTKAGDIAAEQILKTLVITVPNGYAVAIVVRGQSALQAMPAPRYSSASPSMHSDMPYFESE